MKANIIYNRRCKPTIDILTKIGKEKFNIDFSVLFHYQNNDLPTIYFGKFDQFALDKADTLEYLSNIMPNTLVDVGVELDKNTIVVAKNPTRILLFKDCNEVCYNYIINKSEWRINVSYGKINQILNKNIVNEPFGKADLTQWTPETDKAVRKILIDYSKKIYDKIHGFYPRIEHFGLDIIRDNTNNQYYLLELNRANGLNEESCEYLLNGFINTYGGDTNG
jgi:hypothetical protein